MRIWFDTEFIEDGRTIELISIGMFREDGASLYFENAECDLSRACPWVQENVIPHLSGGAARASRATIAQAIVDFAGESPEFWGYFADYDWVVLCQLYGRMVDLPRGWPMFCRDVQQWRMDLGSPELPPAVQPAHNAYADAFWTYRAWRELFNLTLETKNV